MRAFHFRGTPSRRCARTGEWPGLYPRTLGVAEFPCALIAGVQRRPLSPRMHLVAATLVARLNRHLPQPTSVRPYLPTLPQPLLTLGAVATKMMLGAKEGVARAARRRAASSSTDLSPASALHPLLHRQAGAGSRRVAALASSTTTTRGPLGSLGGSLASKSLQSLQLDLDDDLEDLELRDVNVSACLPLPRAPGGDRFGPESAVWPNSRGRGGRWPGRRPHMQGVWSPSGATT